MTLLCSIEETLFWICSGILCNIGTLWNHSYLWTQERAWISWRRDMKMHLTPKKSASKSSSTSKYKWRKGRVIPHLWRRWGWWLLADKRSILSCWYRRGLDTVLAMKPFKCVGVHLSGVSGSEQGSIKGQFIMPIRSSLMNPNISSTFKTNSSWGYKIKS